MKYWKAVIESVELINCVWKRENTEFSHAEKVKNNFLPNNIFFSEIRNKQATKAQQKK